MSDIDLSNLTSRDIVRFWAKVHTDGECWEWTAYRSPRGYGRFQVNHHMAGAHRVAWTIHHGPIPDGLLVCHRCDNPPCCNPEHLFLGTQSDNIRDAHEKGHGFRHQPKDVCLNGHPQTPENVRVWESARGIERRCRVCARAANRAYYRRSLNAAS